MTSTTFFIIFIPILAIILLAVNLILAPHNPYQEKDSPFECGFHSFSGQNRTQFSISFFIFALLFLLFDLEIVLIYPYSVSGYNNGIYGLAIMIVFFLVLTGGFVFELGKNALSIESRQTSAYENADTPESHAFINLKLKNLSVNTRKSTFIYFNILMHRFILLFIQNNTKRNLLISFILKISITILFFCFITYKMQLDFISNIHMDNYGKLSITHFIVAYFGIILNFIHIIKNKNENYIFNIINTLTRLIYIFKTKLLFSLVMGMLFILLLISLSLFSNYLGITICANNFSTYIISLYDRIVFIKLSLSIMFFLLTKDIKLLYNHLDMNPFLFIILIPLSLLSYFYILPLLTYGMLNHLENIWINLKKLFFMEAKDIGQSLVKFGNRPAQLGKHLISLGDWFLGRKLTSIDKKPLFFPHYTIVQWIDLNSLITTSNIRHWNFVKSLPHIPSVKIFVPVSNVTTSNYILYMKDSLIKSILNYLNKIGNAIEANSPKLNYYVEEEYAIIRFESTIKSLEFTLINSNSNSVAEYSPKYFSEYLQQKSNSAGGLNQIYKNEILRLTDPGSSYDLIVNMENSRPTENISTNPEDYIYPFNILLEEGETWCVSPYLLGNAPSSHSAPYDPGVPYNFRGNSALQGESIQGQGESSQGQDLYFHDTTSRSINNRFIVTSDIVDNDLDFYRIIRSKIIHFLEEGRINREGRLSTLYFENEDVRKEFSDKIINSGLLDERVPLRVRIRTFVATLNTKIEPWFNKIDVHGDAAIWESVRNNTILDIDFTGNHLNIIRIKNKIVNLIQGGYLEEDDPIKKMPFGHEDLQNIFYTWIDDIIERKFSWQRRNLENIRIRNILIYLDSDGP